jgi:asparagine synthetase B (glutamine-hydrolysing)
MCGIFGLFVNPESGFSAKEVKKITVQLALMSESRGKDSSGMAFVNHPKKAVSVVKGDIRIKKLLESPELKILFTESLEEYDRKIGDFSVFGHARLVTNGSQLETENNQPVIKNGNYLIHNGIVVNAGGLWPKHPELKREFKIDSEIILDLLDLAISLNTKNIIPSIEDSLDKLEGTYSIMAFFPRINKFILASNNGSLYCLSDRKNYLVFASERYYLEELTKTKPLKTKSLQSSDIRQIQPRQVLVFNTEDFDLNVFENGKTENSKLNFSTQSDFSLSLTSLKNPDSDKDFVIEPDFHFNRNKEKRLFDLLENQTESIKNLKRCTRCVLPETFPFIQFDQNGICNYCRSYVPKQKPKDFDALRELVKPYRNQSNKHDCIVPFSGGRDSTFVLHVVREELGLNPIAFTYDWGMVTDLARRNIARVCGKLGVENVVVAADIHWKRQNIRKNIEAWLRKPHLGMIPLFMAGDKYFFYYTDRLKKQTGIDLNIWGVNHLENTDFKTGFSGLAPEFDKKRIFSLSVANQLKLVGFIIREVSSNSGYLNQSIWDSLGSFAVRYLTSKKDYVQLFDYYPWDESEINGLIESTYQWEKAPDTTSTWRIGDGTAGFYNYIYHTVAGFSEVDTFRSNQIREGMISRASAMDMLESENLPRYETIRWYLEILGIDFQEAIFKINRIPKLYSVYYQ